MGSSDYNGNQGAFCIPTTIERGGDLWVIASDGEGWEHVSIHGINSGKMFTPTWDQMCFIKDLFWDAEDCVIQYHRPKSQYVNLHPNTLHLWRQSGKNSISLPPKILIG